MDLGHPRRDPRLRPRDEGRMAHGLQRHARQRAGKRDHFPEGLQAPRRHRQQAHHALARPR
eukprot:6944401-Lingulodinium_polyedra.AAC.1